MAARSVGFLDLEPSLTMVRQQLDDAWEQVLEHRQFVGGPEVTEFEKAFARFCGATHCVGVANGTDAIELVLVAMGIERGSEVIIPTNTFVATAEAVTNVGAIPRFVDVDEQTLLLTPEIVREAVTARTSAVIAVHLFGQPCDMAGIAEVASTAGIAVLEDAAQAHGAQYMGRRIGTHSVAATFSFYPGKNLGAFGDGGAVVTTDPLLADRIRSLGFHGRSADDRFAHAVVGRNSRLDTLQAAVLRVRLGQPEHENAHRREARGWYEELLPAAVQLVTQAPDRISANHLVVVQTDNRDRLRQDLERRGVATGIHYPVPCHLQPAFTGLPSRRLPVAEVAAGRILSLPVWGQIERQDVEYVCEQIDLLSPPTDGDQSLELSLGTMR